VNCYWQLRRPATDIGKKPRPVGVDTKRPRFPARLQISAREISMKTITVGLAALLLSTAASFAADAWTEAEVHGTKIYTDANGRTLYA